MGRTPQYRDLSEGLSTVILLALIAGSIVWRGLQARLVASPWIMPDELIYSSLARSVASSGELAIRGTRSGAYSVLYPLLQSLPFSASTSHAAYAAAKWENAVLMSLAAIPVYLLARRLLPNALALLAAALTLLMPSMAYTGLLMTENAFFPLFLLALVAIVRTLEHPTAVRQISALGVIVLAYLARAEGIVLLAILVLAAAAFSFAGESPRRELRRYRPTLLAFAAGAAALVAAEAVRGSSPWAFLGIYESTIRSYPLEHVPRWLASEVVDLELYLGFLPLVPALVVAWSLLGEGFDRRRRAVGAVFLSAFVCVLLLVALFSVGPTGSATYPALPRRLHERYLFYVVPLFLILFLAWLYRRPQIRRGVFAALLLLAALLPLSLPYSRLLTNAAFEAPALLPWNNSLISGRHVPLALCVTAAVLLPLLFVRRRSILLLDVSIVAFFMLVVGLVATADIRHASTQLATSYPHAPAWIDRAVPPAGTVAVLWRRGTRWPLGRVLAREHELWRAEFFNRSVDRYYYVGSPMHYGLPETRARLESGRIVLPGGRDYRYILSASPLPHLKPIARDSRAGLTLYERT